VIPLGKENVLVCVSYPESAGQLIERGIKETKAFQSECIVLHVYDPENDTSDMKEEEKREEIKKWADFHKATMILQPRQGSKKLGEIIGEVARANDVHHIIIGQAFRSRWDLLIHGSLVNELFHELEDVDVTIFKIKKDRVAAESHYDKGVSGYLYKKEEQYKIALEQPRGEGHEGIFFQHLHTDFLTGIFKAKIFGHPVVLYVVEGDVHERYREELDTILEEK
jgi:two-component system, OmpR family, sensor histidine kinase KdpD